MFCAVGMALLLFTGTVNMVGAGCRNYAWVDRNGKVPRTKAHDLLKCRRKSADVQPATGPAYGHFQIYYNKCGTGGCTGEQITRSDADHISHFVECAWALFIEPEMSSAAQVFHNPLDSMWLTYPNDPDTTTDDHIPVWINKGAGSGGGTGEPGLYFPATERVREPISHNAVHEFGHVLERTYSSYLTGGYLQFVNEGLPTFFESVLREYNSHRYVFPPFNKTLCRDRGNFVDLADTSLRNREYCEAANFWHFLGGFTLLNDPEYYDTADLVPACSTYLAHVVNPPDSGQMRRIPGRDVILEVLEQFETCFPLGNTTPACSHNGGYAAECAGPGFPDGCMPKVFVDSRDHGGTFDENKEKQMTGEVLMPRVLEKIDQAMTRFVGTGTNPRFTDGVPYRMFRQYLEYNFEQSAARQSFWYDAKGFRIRSFSAHYHEIDISKGSRTVYLKKGGDLPQWAYGVFYKGDLLSAVDGWGEDGTYRHVSAWKQLSSPTITIPARAGFDTAVIIVTVFQGTYDPDKHLDYTQSGGHYLLLTDKDRVLAGNYDGSGPLGNLALFSDHAAMWFFDMDRDGTFDKAIRSWGPRKKTEGGQPKRPRDIPVVGDFNRDGRDDIAVFSPADRELVYSTRTDRSDMYRIDLSKWFKAGDFPFAGDFDCDGYRDDVGVFRASNRAWYFDLDHDNSTDSTRQFGPWGLAGDIPVIGDFDKDGCFDDVAVFRPSTKRWYFNYSNLLPSGKYFDNVSDKNYRWAVSTDIPFAGDLGRPAEPSSQTDGIAADVGVFRPSTRTWIYDIEMKGLSTYRVQHDDAYE